MAEIRYRHVEYVLNKMWVAEEIKLPYANPPRPSGGHAPELVMNETEWEKLPWNPPYQWENADPDADPKPAWADLLPPLRAHLLEATVWDATAKFNAFSDGGRARLSAAEPSVIDGENLYSGAGLERMAGLANLVRNADLAGETAPRIILRSVDHQEIHTWSLSRIGAILQQAAARENIVQSAHNQITAKYRRLLKKAADMDLPYDDRLKAAGDALQLGTDYDASLEAAADAFDPDALPEDPDALRTVLVERLESAATKRQKYLKGAVSQQAIDNWAQCDGVDRALKEVSKQCALGVIRINRAGSNSDAEAAHAEAVATVEAVPAIHTPVWQINGGEVLPANPVTQHAEGSHVDIIAKHPPGQLIEGEVMAAARADKPITVTPVTPGAQTPASASVLRVTLLSPAPVGQTVIELTARNLCGPSRLLIVLTP